MRRLSTFYPLELEPVLLDVGQYVIVFMLIRGFFTETSSNAANRWLSLRFSLVTSIVSSTMALTAVLTPSIDAATAGFALSFGLTLMEHVCPGHHIYALLALTACTNPFA